MKKIRIIETFSGIGSQHKAITRVNKKIGKDFFDIVATCDWDIYSAITYDAIHKNKYKIDKISEEKKLKFLKANSWSKDGSIPISESSFDRLDSKVINQLFKSVKGHQNFGSIITLGGNKILKKVGSFDLLTYSFPCQNLSNAGAFHSVNTGMKEKSGTKSGLIWEIKRILLDLKERNELPKYLLLENVPAMTTHPSYSKDYKKWIDFLSSLGYKTNTQILNAIDFGIPQKRKRAFALSILNYDGEIIKEDKAFPLNKGGPKIDYDKKLIAKDLQTIIKEKSKFLTEYNDAVPNDTPSRKIMRTDNPKLRSSKYIRTITTKQDRHPNSGTVEYKNTLPNKSQYRFITPRESFILMGFDSKDYDKAKKTGVRKALLYKQAGNSVVVNILESIFMKIYEMENKEK